MFPFLKSTHPNPFMPKVGKIYTSNLKYLNLIQIMEFNVPTNVTWEW